jgi:serine/threonine protein kinase
MHEQYIGKTISSRYLVERLIAQGGMAAVFEARDLRLERTVAIKIVHQHLLSDSSFIERFEAEAKNAAKLNHPNLVNVLDQGEDGSIVYLVMEYVPGMTLRDAIKRFGALEAHRSLELLEYVLSGLAAAHRAGILHRDIKPENILLADDGRVKLADFGLSRAVSANTQTASVIGTVAYLSPELVTRGVADARSDVYAIGILLFELVTGQQPYQGEQAVQVAFQHANSRVPAPSTVRAGVPAEIDDLVLWATAKDPIDRPADARELLAAVSEAKAAVKSGIRQPRSNAATKRISAEELASETAGATERINVPVAAPPMPAGATERLDLSSIRWWASWSRACLRLCSVRASAGGSAPGREHRSRCRTSSGNPPLPQKTNSLGLASTSSKPPSTAHPCKNR